MFLKMWTSANELETQRIRGIHVLYEEIVKANKGVYAEGCLAQLMELRSQHTNNDLYQFRGIA